VNGTPAWARLAGNATATRKFLRQTGSGTVSALPAWDTLLAGDIPAHAHDAAIAAGAVLVSSKVLVTRLAAAGLRRPKHLHRPPIAEVEG